MAITAFSITGAGTIQANGGDSNNTGGGYGAGAGGRIALKLTGPGDFTGFTGLVTAYGGDSPRYLSDGAAGTIYEELAAQAGGHTGELIVRQFSSSAQPGDGVFTRMPAGTNVNQFSTVTIQNTGNLAVGSDATIDFGRIQPAVNIRPGTSFNDAIVTILGISSGTTFPDSYTITGYTLSTGTILTMPGDLTLATRGGLTHPQNQTAETWKLNLRVNGNFTVNSDATVSADGRGYNNYLGPGGATSAHTYAGAGYGGRGGGHH